MNRVVLAARGQRLTLIEGSPVRGGGRALRGIVTLIADDMNGGNAILSLDDADLAALKVFIDGRLAALTPGGDELDVDGNEWKGVE